MRRSIGLLVAALLVAPPAPTRAESHGFESSACPIEVVDVALRCGYVEVPLRRDGSDERTLRLAVVIASAGSTPARDPVVYLAGGPGGAGTSDLPKLLEAQPEFRALLEEREWIFVDQRGTGSSEPNLTCPEVILGPQTDTAAEVEQTLACGVRLAQAGHDLASFTTAENAADIAAMIDALAYEQVNLYGASYGSRLALALMRARPERIRAAVLDGVYPLQAATYADMPGSFSRSLRALFAACAGDARCNLRYPDLEGRFLRLMTRLANDPPSVSYVDPRLKEARQVPLTTRTFLGVLFTLLYQREGIQIAPALIGTAAAGDLKPIESLLWVLDVVDDGVSLGMHYSAECADEGWRANVPTTDLVPFAEVRDGMGTAAGFGAICADWPTRPPSTDSAEAVWSDVPSLLLVGRFDPVTPPDYAHSAAATLSHARVVELAAQGHVTLPSSACSVALARRFYTEPTVQLGVGCADHTVVEFVLPP
jgi:pimeloyl-ACP methyl ester carboxylesterase